MGLMLHPWVLICLLFLSVLLAVEIGRDYGWRRGDRLKADSPGANALSAAIFALMGLFMAFSFSGAASRYDARRQLIINEINTATTVSARVSLAPAATQPAMRATLSRYIAARMEADHPDGSSTRFVKALRKANDIQAELWQQAVAASQRPDAGEGVVELLLPSINAMNEAALSLAYMSLMHPPPIIHYMLIILAWAAAFLAGIGLSIHNRRSWVHAISFAAIVTAVIFITIDLEYPRAGFIRTDGFEKAANTLSTLH